MQNNWPGNVRELRNYAYRHILQLGKCVDDPVERIGLSDKLDRFEASLIRDALAEAQGDVKHTAELLQLPRKTLYAKIVRHGIDLALYRS